MATTLHCDWCGEEIEDASEHPAVLRPDGRTEDGRWLYRPHFQYHAVGDDSCLVQAVRVLQDRARWVDQDEDTSRLEWRLMPAPRTTDPAGDGPLNEEFRERTRAGSALYKLGIHEAAKRGLRSVNVVTLEELAARSEEEIAAVDGVGPKSLTRLRSELGARGLMFGSEGVA